MPFRLSSPAFSHEGTIPRLYTGQGKNISPPLSWSDPPEGTQSFALITIDTDTPIGTLTHWVAYNIPAHEKKLKEAVPRQAAFPTGMIQGRNGLWRHGYMGPNPPWGRHRYYFTLYALDTVLPPHTGLNRRRLLRAMEGHILGQAQLMGYYSKKAKK